MKLPKSLEGFKGEEEGGMTALGLYVAVAMFVLGGLAIDVSGLINARTQLQVAADFAAHAALYTRELNTADEAKAQAIELTEASFPTLAFGDLLTTADIQFGTYDSATQTFSVDSSSKEAVYVQTERLSANANPVTSLLMQFAGFAEWDVITPSVFETFVPSCLRDGWIAEEVVDAQSNNDFTSGFCVHSNTHVEVNNNNTYENGVTVSMPDRANMVVPLPDGWDQNIGLAEALTDDYMNLRILTQLDQIQAGLYDDQSDHFREYVTDVTPIAMGGGTHVKSDFLPTDRIYEVTCTNGNKKTLTLNVPDVLRDVVIVTNCPIKFGNGSALENVVIFTTNTDVKSITAPQGVRLGADDGCDPDGGVQIVTYGGFEVASKLEIYSSQVIAKGPIQFSASANGVEGGSFISGETIDGTSNTAMGSCPNMDGEVFTVDLFRMAG